MINTMTRKIGVGEPDHLEEYLTQPKGGWPNFGSEHV